MIKEELIIKKKRRVRHSDEIPAAFLLQIAASHTSVEYNTHPIPHLDSKLFLQVCEHDLYVLLANLIRGGEGITLNS